ncbi:MAG: MutS-related protein [Terriglobales bacterium]
MAVSFYWGQVHDRERDWATLERFYQACPPPDAADALDAQTWDELHLGPLFARLDRTLSTPGACWLYRLLHIPVLTTEVWRQRQRTIQALGEDASAREALQDALAEAGRRRGAELTSLLWDELPERHGSVWIFRALVAATLASLLLFLLTFHLPWFILLVALAVADARVHYGEQRRLEGRLGALHQLRHLIAAAGRAGQMESPPALAASAGRLRTAARSAHRLKRRLNWLLPEFSNAALGDISSLLLDYVDMFLLHQVRTFYACLAELKVQLPALRQIFITLGELDACQAIANWRAGTEGWCEPELDDSGPRLDIADACHPLLAAPIPNSFILDKPGAAVTGSNMSGKTTFLRTIAVNVVLAQTVATCFAASYRGRTLVVMTSMNTGDNLLEGKSYYLAEAERLLQIVRLAEGPRPILALIDEPLAGTNSPERHAASREILRYLASHRGLVLASTHDVDLVRALEACGLFAAYHFSDSADAKGLRFDYTLHPGLDYHANALTVLRFLGYPEAILAAAEAPPAKNVAPHPNCECILPAE